jgi:cell division protein FtsN
VAPRDYGQKGAGRSHTRIAPPMPGWVWLTAGLSMGLAVAAFIYIARPAAAPGSGKVGEIPVMATKETPPDRKKVEIPPKEKSRFSFYELLPSYEVVIPREKKRPGEVAPIAEPGTYIIQVGSFKGAADAERQKANLALLGIESRLEKVTIDNKETWYRVRIGPEKDLARVHSTLSLLEENRIQSFLVRVKG